jgi:hypothetical protein
MVVIDGIPLHPLVVHAIVVLLPLATLGTVVIAIRRSWRRTLGIPVLLIALVGVISVPVATTSGAQLRANLPANPLLDVHADLGSMLLPYAVGYLVLLAAAVVVEISTERVPVPTGSHALRETATSTRSRIATVLAVLAALGGIGVTYLVVLIGHAGSRVVWQGIGQ